MDDNAKAQAIIEYIKTQVLRNQAIRIEPDTPLVSSGLVDSFSLIDVLLELEKITGRRIPAARVSPPDMETVTKMLALAERLGKPV
jgi:acyl carrier protein